VAFAADQIAIAVCEIGAISQRRIALLVDPALSYGLPAFLANKPANLTSPIVQSKSDGSIFLTVTNGVEGKMPALNENLLVPDRWDLVNFIRTLTAED